MNRDHVLITVIGPALVLGVGVMGLVWPNYRAAAAASSEITRLEGMHDSMARLTTELEEIVDERSELRKKMASTMKVIPSSPDVPMLMRKLQFSVDDWTVRDQMLTAGAEGDAIEGVPTSEKALPLTVQMDAYFDSIFALIRIAESMDRLVRVASLHVHTQEDDDNPLDRGLLNATVVLEAIYDSGVTPEEAP